MPGQALVTIGSRQWQVALATQAPELAQGLGGLPALPPGQGMLFDLGYEQRATVTTAPMLFPLDILWIGEDLRVSGYAGDVPPGQILESWGRYFLEVNAGEAAGVVRLGDPVQLQVAEPPPAPSLLTSLVGPLVSLLGLFLALGLVRNMVRAALPRSGARGPGLLPRTRRLDPRLSPALLSEGGEPVPAPYRDLLGLIREPLLEDSLAVWPAVVPAEGERKIEAVLRQLKEGVEKIQDSGQFRLFLTTMAKFHDYSVGNLILIALQRPSATRVAGFSKWKELGRWVKSGEKGIAILAPVMPPKPKPEEEADLAGALKPVHFKVVHVFDLRQTEGKPLPEFAVPALTGEGSEELFSGVMALAQAQGLEVSFEPRPHQDPAIKGQYLGRSIWIRPQEARAQQLKSLLHEVAHYYSEGVFRLPRGDSETIAESAAFAVGARFGFDTGVRSFPYVALWARDRKVLAANLGAIRKVAEGMIEALGPEPGASPPARPLPTGKAEGAGPQAQLWGPRERRHPPEEMEFFADSPDHCCGSVDGTGLRPHLEEAFQEAIARARGLDRTQGRGRWQP